MGGLAGQPGFVAQPSALLPGPRRQRRTHGDAPAEGRRGHRPLRSAERRPLPDASASNARSAATARCGPVRRGRAVELRAGVFLRELDPRWRRTSYSAITSGDHEPRVASEPELTVISDEAPPTSGRAPVSDVVIGPEDAGLRSTAVAAGRYAGGCRRRHVHPQRPGAHRLHQRRPRCRADEPHRRGAIPTPSRHRRAGCARTGTGRSHRDTSRAARGRPAPARPRPSATDSTNWPSRSPWSAATRRAGS